MRIAINLLPQSYHEAKKKKQVVLLAIAGGVVVALLFVGFNIMKMLELHTIKKKIANVEEQQKTYQDALAEIERIKLQKTQVDERESMLKTLATVQGRWPKFLMNFGKVIPHTIWITTARNTPGDKRVFTIEGRALSKQSVADFLSNLQRNMPDIEEASAKQIEAKGTGLGETAYVLSFKIKL